MLYNPHLMFPVNRSYLLTWLATDPGSPLRLNLLTLLPAFAWPDPATQAFVTGRPVAVAFVVVLGSYLLQRTTAADSDTSEHGSTSFRTVATFTRATRPWLLCAATVLAGWYIMNFQFLQRQTVLTEQHRWTLAPAPIQSTAAAFWKGRLFVADYAGGAVDELDVRAGTSTSLRVTSAGRLVRLFHPGSVAMGQDGLLYVLNNGPGNQALYVMRPTGQLIRTEPLAGKFPISVGMALVGHSGLYVTDMTAGAVRRYGPGGGNELSSWTGTGRVFNNLAGLIRGPDGLIYAAETSANRVLAFDSSGKVVRTYDVACSPHQLVQTGRWIDVTCGTGLISIDTASRRAQASHLATNAQSLSAPSALAYGPGGLLYVVDGSAVLAYTVTH
jgi:hypothetical protein